jgi:hypothetical protein
MPRCVYIAYVPHIAIQNLASFLKYFRRWSFTESVDQTSGKRQLDSALDLGRTVAVNLAAAPLIAAALSAVVT